MCEYVERFSPEDPVIMLYKVSLELSNCAALALLKQ